MRAARFIVVFAVAAPAAIGVTVLAPAGEAPAAGSARAAQPAVRIATLVHRAHGRPFVDSRGDVRAAQRDDAWAVLPSPGGLTAGSAGTVALNVTSLPATVSTARPTARAPPARGVRRGRDPLRARDTPWAAPTGLCRFDTLMPTRAGWARGTVRRFPAWATHPVSAARHRRSS